MIKHTFLALAVVLALAAPASSEDTAQLPALTFDEVNTPLADVVAKATAAKKPIFIDFFLDG